MKFRQVWTALRALLIFTIVLGVAYPLAITGLGQLALPAQSNGQLVAVNGSVVGSAVIGQSFTDYGPENPDLIAAIQARQAAIESSDSISLDRIPADAVTASASGLDPHISPAYALLQVPRVAAARSLDAATVRELVTSMIQGRDLGYLGEPTVNVLQLNIALTKLGK
jgi:K+-transporting ATPase ATPase C chain